MQTLKIGINGFGRIGRMVFRAAAKRQDVEVVAINDLLDIDHLVYLLKYDSVHGNFDGTVEIQGENIVVNGKTVRITAERDPKALKWDAVGASIVAECTGIFTTKEMAQAHIDGGAKKVVVSAPSADAPMFVMGVNHNEV
ncbi:MAG: glyceraldehyde 3-phosphate dehydrogenase NAD-binding domain-containing protein, partial [Flavobacteriaceae bacterium]